MPRPAGDNITLTGVSCTQPARCTAVGYTSNGSQQQTAVVERWDETSWAIQNDAAPAQAMLSGTSALLLGSPTGAGDVFPFSHYQGPAELVKNAVGFAGRSRLIFDFVLAGQHGGTR